MARQSLGAPIGTTGQPPGAVGSSKLPLLRPGPGNTTRNDAAITPSGQFPAVTTTSQKPRAAPERSKVQFRLEPSPATVTPVPGMSGRPPDASLTDVEPGRKFAPRICTGELPPLTP